MVFKIATQRKMSAGLQPALMIAGILPAFFLVLCGIVLGQDFSPYQKREFQGMPYRILYPLSYDTSRKYPLVLFLHGSGERGNDNEKQLVHGGALFLKNENRKHFPAIVVFPQCPEDGYWAAVTPGRDQLPLKLDFDDSRPITPQLKTAMELTENLIEKEKVDPKRVYIVGLSMGGMGTFEAVYRYPQLFAAAIAIAGGGDAKAYDKRVAKIPFWVFHGAADDVVEVRHSRIMVERLKQLKAEVRYTEYPGVKHESWDDAFADPEFLPWLFSKRKR